MATAKKKPAQAGSEQKEELTDIQKLTQRVYELEHLTNSLNIALVGAMYSAKITPARINKVTAEDLLAYTNENVHPMIRRADELVTEISNKAKAEIAHAAAEAKQKEEKDA